MGPVAAQTTMIATASMNDHELPTNQTCLNAARLFRRHQVSHNCVKPRVGIYSEKDRRVFADFKLIDRRLGEEFAKDSDLLHHFFANFFRGDALHGLGNEIEIAFISDAEFNFIPNVREQRPTVVVNS